MTAKSKRTKSKSTRSRIVRKWDGRQAGPLASGQSISMKELRERLDDDPTDLQARLLLAERLLSRNKAEEGLTLLDDPDSPLHSDDRTELYWEAMRLRGFALAHVKRFDDALRVAQDIIADFFEAPDGHYLAAYAANRSGNWDASRTHANGFIACVLQPAKSERSGQFWTTADRLYEGYNYLGAACEQLGDVEQAVDAYKHAIEEKPTFDIGWANLAQALTKTGRQTEAEATLREALKVCPKSRALRNLKAGKPRAARSGKATSDGQPVRKATKSIALCMIVKNEEEHLPNALTSAKPLVDQIIVVDTGSTDRTVEIAKSFGAEVYHHEWEGDFSKARNISMGYADADWILILDADEELVADDLPIIRQTIETTDMKAISVSVYNYSREKRMYTSFLPSVRFFRRDLGAYYDGIVHNQLRFPTEEGVLRIPARIQHYGYGLSPEVMARKIARTQGLLEKQLKENPNNAFAHFNIAQLLRGTEDLPTPAMMDKVIYHAGRAVDLTSPDERNERHIHLMALHQLVTAYFNKGDHERAAEYAHRALAHKPGYLDAILSLGHIHSMDGQYELAQKYYLEYLDRQKSYDEHAEVDHVILLHLRSRHNAYYGLGLVSEMQGHSVEAVGWYERCIEERDDYIDVHFRLATMLAAIGQRDRARRELKTELNRHPDNTDARIALADHLIEVADNESAAKYLEDGLAHDPRNAALAIRLGQLDVSARRFRDAIKHFEVVPDDHKHGATARRLRADAHFELKEYDRAADLYEQMLQATPDDFDILNNLANCHFRLSAYERAEAIYRRIIDAGRAAPHVYRNLGVTQARMDHTDDAIFTLESYAELHPDDIETAGYLGDLHYSCKNFSRAIDEYERVLERQPNRPDTLTRLGDCYLNQGAIAAALVGYERALEADPDYKPAWARLRDVREHLVARLTKMPESPGE